MCFYGRDWAYTKTLGVLGQTKKNYNEKDYSTYFKIVNLNKVVKELKKMLCLCLKTYYEHEYEAKWNADLW